MKVRDLIALLKEQPQEAEIILDYEYYDENGHLAEEENIIEQIYKCSDKEIHLSTYDQNPSNFGFKVIK